MPSELAQLGKHVFFGAGFLSNLVLWSESGYFDNAASLKPLLHLWSLGIEEQFYILWPALLWVVFRMKAKVGRLLAVLFLASFVINVVLSVTDIAADFYLPVSGFWELLAGAGLASWGQIVLSPNVRSWISFAGLVALRRDPNRQFEVIWHHTSPRGAVRRRRIRQIALQERPAKVSIRLCG